MKVSELHREFGRLARSFSIDENPLAPLTGLIPLRANNFCVVTPNQEQEATRLMKQIAGRRKLRVSRHHKDEMRQPDFSPVEDVIVIYA